MGLEEMIPGPTFMRDVDRPDVQSFIDRYDVENECRHGHLPHEGCGDCVAEAGRPFTPDLMKVLPRVPARRVLRAVAEGDPAPVEGGVDRLAA